MRSRGSEANNGVVMESIRLAARADYAKLKVGNPHRVAEKVPFSKGPCSRGDLG